VTETSELGGGDPRFRAAWRQWLDALASDADAALAATDVYAELGPSGRDAWLDALAEDAPSLSVPVVAVYAPLLAVEDDPARRGRMEKAIARGDESAWRGRPVRTLSGIAASGDHVVALVLPVYLRFVRVLWCRFHPNAGFTWARHDSLMDDDAAPNHGAVVDGVVLETTPLTPVIEALAHAVLAQRRRGEDPPASLCEFPDLFDADVDAIEAVDGEQL